MTAWFAFSYLRGYRWLLALSDRSTLALPSISRGGSVVNGHLDHWPAGRLKCPPAFYAPTLTRPSRNSAEILIDTPISPSSLAVRDTAGAWIRRAVLEDFQGDGHRYYRTGWPWSSYAYRAYAQLGFQLLWTHLGPIVVWQSVFLFNIYIYIYVYIYIYMYIYMYVYILLIYWLSNIICIRLNSHI